MNPSPTRLLLTCCCCLLLPACSASRPPALDDTIARSDGRLLPPLRLTQAWDGKPVDLPAPALWPDAARASPEYQRWLRTGNVTELRHTDPADGHTYVANAAFRYRDSAGKTHAYIQQVTDYRPDGTRARQTQFLPAGYPEAWTTYAPDGQSPLLKVHTQRLAPAPVDGPIFVSHFVTRNPDTGEHRRYHCTPDATITTEWPANARGDTAGDPLHSRHRLTKSD